uniref:NADH-ubiquinone oxidoreductase chain 4 n=1 Tax=Schizopera knabeni TaxID=1432316 RepID=W8DND7_9MAXI|nr:NADH dehydrogenase subunit 4 [Schizopera knabeni]
MQLISAILFLLAPLVALTSEALVALSAILVIMMMWAPQWSTTAMSSTSFFVMDLMSWGLICLSVLICFFMCLVESQSTMKNKDLKPLSMVMLLVLILLFMSKTSLVFYFLFEASLIPISLMILGWGYQPERLSASVALLAYTIVASLPLLWMVSTISSMSYFNFDFFKTHSVGLKQWSSLVDVFLLGAFMVKFPMFMVHMWLPKAHVEAPVIGSMVLAALLLKLAGFGLWRLSAALTVSPITHLLGIVAMVGGSLVAILCLGQLDMKVLIAYSSVSHMSFAIFCMLSFSPSGYLSALMMMVSHGVSSSAMFSGANYIYMKVHSRNFLLMNGLMAVAPAFTLSWFLVCMGNMGAPPTVNLLAEIWSGLVLVNTEMSMAAPFMLSTFFAVAFTLVIYTSPAQGQPSNLSTSSSQVPSLPLLVLLSHSFFFIVASMFFF